MKRVIALLVLGELFSTGVAIAQLPRVPAPQQNASPIELAAQPERMAPGTSVTINGMVARQGSTPLIITVKPPAGTGFSQTVSPDANGAFSIQYKDTKTSGTYQVQAALGSTRKTTSFEVGVADIARNTIQQAQQILQTADFLVQQGKRQYANSSASKGPNSAAVDKQIAQLQEIIAEGKKFWTPSSRVSGTASGPSTFADVLLDVTRQIQKRPDMAPRFAANLNQLQSWSEQANLSLKRLKSREPMLKSAQLMNRKAGGILTYVNFPISAPAASQGSADSCKTIKEGADFFETTGSVLSLIGKPITVILNLAAQGFGYLIDLPAAVPIDEHAALAAIEEAEFKREAAQVAEWDRAIATQKSQAVTLATLGAHLAALLGDALLIAECDRWQGPFKATMHAEAYSTAGVGGNGVPWWKYSVQINGTLTLYSNKKDSGLSSVPFIGEFEGNGTNFTVWEEALPVLYPKSFLPGTTISFHKVSATAITNFTACVECVFPGRVVAMATVTDKGDGELEPLPRDWKSTWGAKVRDVWGVDYGPVTFASCPAPNAPSDPAPPEVGVSGQPVNIAKYVAPGLQNEAYVPVRVPIAGGAGLMLFSPAYFRIPVEGEIETNINRSRVGNYQENVKVSLTVQKAEADFDPTLISAHVRYLVVPAALATKAVILIDFGLPYKSAEFILKRALGDTGKSDANGNLGSFQATLNESLASSAGNFRNIRLKFANKTAIPINTVAVDKTQSGRADYCIKIVDFAKHE